MDLFSLAPESHAGEALKLAGMALAADAKAELLAAARELAVKIALSRPDRTCTADDVQAALRARGVSDRKLGNAAGSLFIDRALWAWTGEFVKSSRPHAHANLIRRWKYIGGV